MTPYSLLEGFTLGCDPELFIKNDEGLLVSAVDLIPGSKEDPFVVENGAIQVDGMAAEINIDPASTWEEFNGNIISVVKQLKSRLPKGFTLCVEPSVNFSQEVLDAQPEHAKMMGCDPDFNAWTGEENPIPSVVDPTFRCAGGHIHVGWEPDIPKIVDDPVHLEHCRDLTKQLDWYLGAWAMKLDSDLRRRELYGKAGSFRPKPYGVEYRTLSNFWLTSKERRLAVWNRTVKAIQEMRRMNMPERASPLTPLLIKYINTGEGRDDLTGVRYPLETLDLSYCGW